MQKFRDYLYCDENRINSYTSQIKELNKIEVSGSYEKETSVDGGFSLPIAKGGTNLSEKKTSTYKLNINCLENMVNWVHDKENAINYSNDILNEHDKDKLIVLRGRMTIPEMGENIEAINSFAKNSSLFDMMPVSDEDRQKLSFIKESDNIPVLLELDSDYVYNFNLKKSFLKITNDDFFDNIDEEINVIGRIEKIYNEEADVEIFDLTKEVFKLNRVVRRKLPKENMKEALIIEKGPLVKITPIIIYK